MDAEQKDPDMQAKKDSKVVPPFSGPLASFESWLYEMLVTKAPFQLPVKAKEVLVKVAPWIALIVVVLSLPALFTIFTIGSYVSVYSAYVVATVGFMYYVALAVLAVQLVITLLAIAPLFKQKRNGWMLLLYSSTISVVYSVVNAFSYGFNFGTLLWGLVGAAISYYVLFQVRSYYKS